MSTETKSRLLRPMVSAATAVAAVGLALATGSLPGGPDGIDQSAASSNYRDADFYGINAGAPNTIFNQDVSSPAVMEIVAGDFRVSARVRVDETSAGNASAGIAFLNDKMDTSYALNLYPNEDRWKLTGPAGLAVAEGLLPETSGVGDWHSLSMTRNGEIVIISVDGLEAERAAGLIGDEVVGGIGLRLRNCGASFDDVSAVSEGMASGFRDDFSDSEQAWGGTHQQVWHHDSDGDNGIYTGSVMLSREELMSPDFSPDFSRMFDLLEESGASQIRTFFFWRNMQPQDSDSYYWQYTDAMVIAAHDHGMQVLANVLNAPRWAVAPDDRREHDSFAFPLADMDDLDSFIEAVVERYRPGGQLAGEMGWDDGYGVTYYEIGPEFNAGRLVASGPLQFTGWMGSLDEYVDYLKTGRDAVKAACPDCIVLSGGVTDDVVPNYQTQTDATGARQPVWQGVEDLYAAIQARHPGDRDAPDRYFDILNIHTYQWYALTSSGQKPDSFREYRFPDARWYNDRINKVTDVMQHYGDNDKRVWITEVSYASEDNGDPERGYLSETQQADALEMVYGETGRYPQVEKVFWWNTIDGRSYTGLLRKDLTPKPSYVSYSELT